MFARYAEFFDLFGDFAGFVEFWLVDDLVDAHGSVALFLASDDFTPPAMPRTVAEYLEYCERTVAFVTARNERIRQLGR